MNSVFVYCEIEEGIVSDVSLELLSKGKKLAEELILASKNEGSAIKKRDDTHKMAESNKAFAHFAW